MKWTRILNRVSVPLQALCCAVLYFVMEAICRHSIMDAWAYMRQKPLVFLYNAAFIFATTLIVYLSRRRVFWRILLAALWLVLAIINGAVLMSRVTPFTGPDLLNLGDAIAVSSKYLPPYGIPLIIIGIVAGITVLTFLFIKAPKYQGRLMYRLNLPLVLAGCAGVYGLTQLALEKRVLSNYFGNIAFAYQDYGYPYCLTTTIFNTGISMPRDYSAKEMQRIADTEKNLPETREEGYPNIIFVQLESFFDPETVNYLKISEDPIPNFRRLMEEYSSGYYKVPSVGAGTANTEFETITGMSLHYFGPGEYPYKSILQKTTCESAPYILKDLGYSTHAIHNNEATFYSRRTVFPNLGFDDFISAEYMPKENEKTPLGWVKDEILTGEILKCLESTEGVDYIYTISVQGHGDYPTEPVLEDPLITVSGSATEEQDYRWEYYVNQIHEMDEFVLELTEALSEYPEDVVLVLYGDHLPTMGLTVQDLDNRYLFQTEYVIWDNFGLPRKNDNLASYQIAAEVMDRVGIHEGNIFRYHQARRNSKNYQVDLESLQYDLLYGKGYLYGGESPYRKTAMRMGLYDVTLDSMEAATGNNALYYLHGSNFTPSSAVMLNGELIESVYVNPRTLIIQDTVLTDFDRLAVVQRSNGVSHQSLSKSHDRACYALLSESRWKLKEPADWAGTEK